MGSIDTHVLIRCIIQDNQRQSEAAVRLRQRYAAQGEKLYVPVTVLLECEWVLRSCFSFEKQEIIDAMSVILDARDFFFDKEMAMGDALAVFKLCEADFADCMHARISAWERQGPLYTFDRRASRLPGAELLSIDEEEPRASWRKSGPLRRQGKGGERNSWGEAVSATRQPTPSGQRATRQPARSS